VLRVAFSAGEADSQIRIGLTTHRYLHLSRRAIGFDQQNIHRGMSPVGNDLCYDLFRYLNPAGEILMQAQMRFLALFLLIVTEAAFATVRTEGVQAVAPQSPTPCSAIGELRALAPQLTLFTNPRTGDELEYTVIGDGADSDEVIVMFPGTGSILPDWPVQMLTNSASSPLITQNFTYSPAEDGVISLCHSHHIVLFDYPGVGYSSLSSEVSSDQIANDVDALLDNAALIYDIRTDVVNPLGWSLGTANALKYAFLAPNANPARTIDNLVLIATKPGGNTDGFVDGNQASCINTMFDALKTPASVKNRLNDMLQQAVFELLFPYHGQTPYNGLASSCNAAIEYPDTIALSVAPNCQPTDLCGRNEAYEVGNRQTVPWSITDGVNQDLYNQERSIDWDYSLCYCSAATNNFQSTGCSCSVSPKMTQENGGMCQTTSAQPNAPQSNNCVPISMSGRITVLNGPEDLLIQYTYGRELVTAYQQEYGSTKAAIATYPGSDGAGHGVMLQHPKWVQEHIWTALHPNAAP
jgi:pimeloyl-ACP methyl ester carboxylesterase